LGSRDDTARYVRGNVLALAFVVTDVSLRHPDSLGECRLGQTKPLSNLLDVVRSHASILAPLVLQVNSWAGCESNK